jgi:hypothetical protein
LGLALLVALLAAWLGLLLVARVIQQVRSERFASDLRQFSSAFGDYRQQRGAWPPSTHGETIVPRGMEQSLKETNWSRGSPFGGSYGWEAPSAAGRPGAITLTAFSPALPLKFTSAEMLALDRRMDDGDLAAGRFRAGFNGWPVYLVESKP